MNYAVVTTKIDPQTKIEAMKTARELGLTLSAVIKAFLKQFIHTKSVTFNADEEIPNAYLRRLIKNAEKNLKNGKHSPSFNNAKEAIAFLEKKGV